MKTHLVMYHIYIFKNKYENNFIEYLAKHLGVCVCVCMCLCVDQKCAHKKMFVLVF